MNLVTKVHFLVNYLESFSHGNTEVIHRRTRLSPKCLLNTCATIPYLPNQFLCFNPSWVKLFPPLEICKSSVQTREGSQIQQFKWKCCLTSTPNRIRGELNLLAMSDAWWSTDVFPPTKLQSDYRYSNYTYAFMCSFSYSPHVHYAKSWTPF